MNSREATMQKIPLSKFVILLSVKLSFFASVAFALPVSGNLPEGTSQVITIPTTSSDSTSDVVSDKDAKFKLKLTGRRQFLGFIGHDNQYLPVVLAVKIGKRIVSVQQAIAKDLCSDGKAQGITALKQGLQKATFLLHESDSRKVFASLHSFKRKTTKGEINFRSIGDTKNTVELDAQCVPTGNALNIGLGSRLTPAAEENPEGFTGDRDGDSLPDLFDSDINGDGTLNPYDPTFVTHLASFQLFSNLKVGLAGTVNSNTGVVPTREMVDALLSSNSTLAVEVKAVDGSGETSELDCGSLGYCSTGGTGSVLESGSPFPGPLGGSLDSDSDGHGTITKGPTNDFQLKTGATLSTINSGDSFIQIVTDSSGTERKFFRKLDFVFKGTPGLKSVIMNPASASPTTTTFSYPINSSDLGTPNNCIPIAPAPDASLSLQVTAWRPQRGSIRADEPEFVDLGNSEITIDIPNKPCTTGTACSTTRLPNNCPTSTYTESDSNLTIAGGKLTDTRGDAAADPAQTVTFTVDLKTCLAESADTLDVGEEVALDLQFRSVSSTNGSDNSAVKFCVRRTS
jgi:hypothetical protein